VERIPESCKRRPGRTDDVGRTHGHLHGRQVTHNIFSASKGHEFNLKAQAPGASASVQVSGDVDIEIRCAFHPRMKLVVTVVKP
jgi:hypothetical protein